VHERLVKVEHEACGGAARGRRGAGLGGLAGAQARILCGRPALGLVARTRARAVPLPLPTTFLIARALARARLHSHGLSASHSSAGASSGPSPTALAGRRTLLMRCAGGCARLLGGGERGSSPATRAAAACAASAAAPRWCATMLACTTAGCRLPHGGVASFA
jgi:hypothetical protein